jgi:hypothetical protein
MLVNIALGNTSVAACRPGDANADGQITVDEILAAVHNALNGCDMTAEKLILRVDSAVKQ